jgi:hypothetical protein
MMKRQHFQRGGGGVFNCSICERRTRLVDQGGDSELCPECWELAGLDNMVNDDGPAAGTLAKVAAERDSLLAAAVKKGGNAEKIKASCSFLWPQ